MFYLKGFGTVLARHAYAFLLLLKLLKALSVSLSDVKPNVIEMQRNR